jgi:hypothetical protein
MIATRFVIAFLLAIPAVLSGARAELSIETSGTFQQLKIQGGSPGTRVQFVDGVRPIGVAAVDRRGEARRLTHMKIS